MQNRSFVGTALVGMVVLFILIPWISLSLRNENVDIDGIIVDGISVVQDLMRRSLTNSNETDGGIVE